MALEKNSILVKIPTRWRPEKFLDVLRKYIDFQNTTEVQYLISIDSDDCKMTPQAIDKIYSVYDKIKIFSGESSGKVNAYNRDIEAISGWKILVVTSDDMIPVYQGWDHEIANQMSRLYPDYDGVLHFNDGYTGKKLNTLPIMGKKYYNRFGYVYNPAYQSLWCDNEFMEVAEKLNKQTYFDLTLFRHDHPANIPNKRDAVYNLNESFYHLDKKIFEKRKQDGFPVCS